MIRTTKRVMTILLTLCLLASLLPTAALASEATATISASYSGSGDSLKAGVTASGTITVTVSGGTFSDGAASSVSASGGTELGLTIGPAVYSSPNVTFSVSGVPTQKGTITITAQPDAFEESGKPGAQVTAEVAVAAADNPSVNATGDLTVGQSGYIKLSGNSNFANSLLTTMFTVAIDGENQTVTNAGVGGSGSTSLTLTPTKTGTVSVTIKPEAFTYKPAGDITATSSVTVSLPTVTASYSGETLTAGTQGEIKVTADGNFADSPANNLFTLEGGGVTQPDSVEAGGTNATLKVTPKESGTIKVTKITATAFNPQAAADVTPTGSAITVNAAPDVKVTSNTSLTAGKEPGTITLTIDGAGNEFESTTPGDYALSGVTGLTVSSVEASSTNATLTVTGKPDAQGILKVTVAAKAFKYQPAKASEVSINVAAADVSAQVSGALAVGQEGDVKVTLTGSEFVTSPAANLFTLEGGGVTEPTSVTADGATATLKVTPKETSNIKVTSIAVDALKYKPESAVTGGKITGEATVSAPSGTIAATQSGTLTAGTAASNVTVALEITGSLNFKQTPVAGDFTLGDGATGLTVSKVDYTDGKNVTLTLSGTPNAGGTFQVKVGTSAFTVKPDPDESVTATGNITIGYPNIKLTADPSHIVEDTLVTTITLKAENSVFNATDETGSGPNFALTGNTGITLTSVKATQDSPTATLTIDGMAGNTDDLTITVQKGAFKYQPEDGSVTATISVGKPEGTLAATLNGTLYKGTPVSGQTITLKIENSKGLHFKSEGLVASDFELTGTNLSITDVKFVSTTEATLTLSGTPSASGTFQVKALKDKAFHAAPEDDVTSGDITINAAPTVAVSEVLKTPLYAGTSADGATITLAIESSNTTFAAANKENFSLTGTYADLSIADAKLSSDGKIVLTLSGTPAAKGTFQVQIKPAAFTTRPESDVTATSPLSVDGPKVDVTVSDNTLRAGVDGGSFKLTVSGSTFNSPSGKVSITSQGNITPTLSVSTVEGSDSVITVTVTGKPDIAGNLTIQIAADAFDPQPDEAVTVTVPVAKGEQTETTDSETGSENAAGFGTNVSGLAAAILDGADLTKFENGAEVKFELNVDDQTQVDPDDKTKVDDVSAASGYTVGEYLDVTLSYTINGGSPVDVPTTKTPIKVVFPIPASIQAPGREYAVVRVHDGKAEIIAGPVTGTTITVSTDKFSTYAIIYRAAPASGGTGDGTTGKTAPNTGDSAPLALWTGVLALGLSGLAAVLLRRKKHSR